MVFRKTKDGEIRTEWKFAWVPRKIISLNSSGERQACTIWLEPYLSIEKFSAYHQMWKEVDAKLTPSEAAEAQLAVRPSSKDDI